MASSLWKCERLELLPLDTEEIKEDQKPTDVERDIASEDFTGLLAAFLDLLVSKKAQDCTMLEKRTGSDGEMLTDFCPGSKDHQGMTLNDP